MSSKVHNRLRCGAVVAVLGLLIAEVATVGSAGASRSVRGFDGSTITVAGIGIKKQLPNAERGARARIKRFNDTNEIKGIKIDYKELADDNQDPATAVSEGRRLVSQVGVFAIVGDVSANNPGTYFAQQHVPYFGGGFDNTYCSNKPSTSLWGFSNGGCVVPANPSFVSDNYKAFYRYVSKKTGKKHPTMVLFGNDNDSSKNGNRAFAIASQGAGFKVTDVQNKMPLPPVNDYTPYVQAVMTGNHGSQPDATFCTDGVQCINMWQGLQAAGFKGVYSSGLYSNVLAKPMQGTVINQPSVNFNEDTPGMRQFKADLDAYQPGSSAKVDSGDLFGYASTDMFIQALKTVAKKGKSNITPENVRKAASTMKWEIKGLNGPTEYPKASVMTFPACFSNFESNGTTWNTVVPYFCSRTTYSPKTRIVG